MLAVKKNVFSAVLKLSKDGELRTEHGNRLHAAGPATTNAQLLVTSWTHLDLTAGLWYWWWMSRAWEQYECIPELVVTVPSARSTVVKKIKRFIIWLYKWSRVTFTELLRAVVKIPWHFIIIFHDFPWPGAPWQ